ncbi:MAG TPA: hypothetical protein VK249_11470 [Anaerolineales bacterium]|nr:hypothetical protein [Anaerolineales bacterium]
MKRLFLPFLTILTIALAACSSLPTATSIGAANDDLPIETQLALGTLRLDGTDQEVSVEQAQELFVLWQVYKEISHSDTAAQAEVDGLIAQIQETMTAEQMQAITDMQITQQDVLSATQGMTVVSSSSDQNTVNIPSGSSSDGGMPAGGPPAGGAPPDGGMPMDMGSGAPASGTAQSLNVQTGSVLEGTTEVPSALVEALIELLQKKIAA